VIPVDADTLDLARPQGLACRSATAVHRVRIAGLTGDACYGRAAPVVRPARMAQQEKSPMSDTPQEAFDDCA
jgi:hypothetical protein